MKKVFLIGLCALCFFPMMGNCQDEPMDGLKIWTTSWDNYSGDTGYDILEWTYNASEVYWTYEYQYLQPPEVSDESYSGNIYDMGMDMIYLNGQERFSAILTVSMGASHFPSEGTEFQHRMLSEAGEWELVQDPLFTTPADVSPLGVDIYYDGSELHIAWVEDNDAAGPNSMMCDVKDQVFSVSDEGILTPVGEPVVVFSRELDWSGEYPNNGGLTGLTSCDYDADGDIDLIIGEMYYGSSPSNTALLLIERLSADEWSDTLQELWAAAPGKGSEGVCYCDIDGDENLDLINTTGWTGPWNSIFWFEKIGDTLEQRYAILETSVEGEGMDFLPGHIFGLHAQGPVITGITDWSLF